MLRAVALVSRLACWLASLSTLVCLGLIGASVVARYVFQTPLPWIDKVAGWLVLALVLLAAPEAQRRFEHIGVDVAVGRMGPRLARAAHLAGAASVALVAGILLWAGWETVAFSRMVGLVTDVAEIPEWWVQLLLPVGAAVLLLVSLAQCAVLVAGGVPEHLPTGDEELPRDTLARGE
ncbi:TRAP transporter small permease [Muricoccus nepalensis]|uniref:TRAP transporter small permease n=1 Tax=Muricoccus nepalensis TaxID=1854500 RepID=UPI001386FD58|nr:TRAP transporter small permease [Roseomonas nepalensis]